MSKKISLGPRIDIDLDLLIRTRALIMANSGGGKSYCVRKLAEMCFGHVQIIIIDPEGEFSTLREKFPFVLVGKGGETAADVRSAELLARRLLELNASAICDLYELAAHDRVRWVRAFLESLMAVPKNLWHPVLVIVDEAHKFCPEKGKGSAESLDAVLSLITAGRKRGFCAVCATQRVAKMNKDGVSELSNLIIGRTTWPDDRNTASELLGVGKRDRERFDVAIGQLKPGEFYTFGPALGARGGEIGTVDRVVTTHPEVGKIQTIAPPTPAEVAKLLPRLEDLPKEAEEEENELVNLRLKVDELNDKRDALEREVEELKERPVIDEQARGAIYRDGYNAGLEEGGIEARQKLSIMQAGVAETVPLLSAIRMKLEDVSKGVELTALPDREVRFVSPLPPNATEHKVYKFLPEKADKVVHKPTPGDVKLGGTPQKMLAIICWYPKGVSRGMVAAQCGIKAKTGSYSNNLTELRTKGMITSQGDLLFPTENAVRYFGKSLPPKPQETGAVLRLWESRLSVTAYRMLGALVYKSVGYRMSKERLAASVGIKHDTGSFSNLLSELRTAQLIVTERGSNEVAANKETLFL